MPIFSRRMRTMSPRASFHAVTLCDAMRTYEWEQGYIRGIARMLLSVSVATLWVVGSAVARPVACDGGFTW